MSIREILAEPPKLEPSDLELVIERTLELRQRTTFEASPELLQAIAEADAAPEDQDISIEEAFRIAKSWNTR